MKREDQGLRESMAVSENLLHPWLRRQQEDKLDAATRRGGSKIVHLRPLSRDALARPICLDTEGKSHDGAPISRTEPKDDASSLFPLSTPQ
jgi:hypothetical protein